MKFCATSVWLTWDDKREQGKEQRLTKRMSTHMADRHILIQAKSKNTSYTHTHSHKGVNALIAVCCYPDVSVLVTG